MGDGGAVRGAAVTLRVEAVLLAAGLAGPVREPGFGVEVVLLAIGDPRLDAAPRGTGLLVAATDRGGTAAIGRRDEQAGASGCRVESRIPDGEQHDLHAEAGLPHGTREPRREQHRLHAERHGGAPHRPPVAHASHLHPPGPQTAPGPAPCPL
ncbi:hypothetical protein BV502_01490, partial [Leucobacter sp. OAMLP11]